MVNNVDFGRKYLKRRRRQAETRLAQVATYGPDARGIWLTRPVQRVHLEIFHEPFDTLLIVLGADQAMNDGFGVLEQRFQQERAQVTRSSGQKDVGGLGAERGQAFRLPGLGEAKDNDS